MRTRSEDYKKELIENFNTLVLPLLRERKIKGIVGKTIDIDFEN